MDSQNQEVSSPGALSAKEPSSSSKYLPAILALLFVAVLTSLQLGCIKWFTLPRWSDGIATLLMGAAIFVSGAVARAKWRHVLVMLGIFILWLGARVALDLTHLSPHQGYHPYLSLIDMTAFFWLLGAREALTTGWRKPAAFLWLLLVALAIETLRQMVMSPINWSDWSFTLHPDESSYREYYIEPFLRWPVAAVLAWTAIPLALGIKNRAARSKVVGAMVCAALLGGYFAFSSFLVFDLAKTSLSGKGPYSRNMGVLLLEERGKTDDFDAILHELMAADWQGPIGDPRMHPDWLHTGFAVLARQDSVADRAADAAVSLLRKKRSHGLAWITAELIASRNKIEAAPILLRYALELTPYPTDTISTRALEKMRIPQVGQRIGADYRFAEDASDVEWMEQCHERLVELLGKDPGRDPSTWVRATNEAIVAKRAVLPPAIQDELDREMDSSNRYMITLNRWLDAKAALSRRRLTSMGRRDVIEDMSELKRKVGNRRLHDWELPPSVIAATGELSSVRDAVEADMKVAPPDFDAPTVEAFEDEVDAYARRVEDVIRKNLDRPSTSPAPTQPAASPASRQ